MTEGRVVEAVIVQTHATPISLIVQVFPIVLTNPTTVVTLITLISLKTLISLITLTFLFTPIILLVLINYPCFPNNAKTLIFLSARLYAF